MIRYINGKEKGQVADLQKKKNGEQHSFSRSRKKIKHQLRKTSIRFCLNIMWQTLNP